VEHSQRQSKIIEIAYFTSPNWYVNMPPDKDVYTLSLGPIWKTRANMEKNQPTSWRIYFFCVSITMFNILLAVM